MDQICGSLNDFEKITLLVKYAFSLGTNQFLAVLNSRYRFTPYMMPNDPWRVQYYTSNLFSKNGKNFPFLEKFSIFGIFLSIIGEKLAKSRFLAAEKSDYVGASKTNFYCIFLATFDFCVLIYGTIYFPFLEKNKIKKIKNEENRQNHQFHYDTFVNLNFIFHLRPVWSKI